MSVTTPSKRCCFTSQRLLAVLSEDDLVTEVGHDLAKVLGQTPRLSSTMRYRRFIHSLWQTYDEAGTSSGARLVADAVSMPLDDARYEGEPKADAPLLGGEP